MTAATLIRANLLRHRRRTLFTILGLAVALFLLAVLRSVVVTMDSADRLGSESRLVVGNQLGVVFPLPTGYRARIAQVPGVETVSWSQWFGGVYRDPRDTFFQFAVDGETYLALYPEIVLPEGERAAFLAERTGAVVGRGLAERFGWSVGDRVTLQGTLFPGDWAFTIRGVYTSGRTGFSDELFFFHYAYLEPALDRWEQAGTVQSFVVGITEPELAPSIARAIDAEFENAADQTRTQTEQAYQLGFIRLLGNVSLVLTVLGTAIAFAMLLVSANTMAMSARERLAEQAILKAMGFTGGRLAWLMVAEALVITGAATVLALAGAILLFEVGAFDVGGLLTGIAVQPATAALIAVIALAMGILSALAPARQIVRLDVVTALRQVA